MTEKDIKLIESFTWLAVWKCKHRQDTEDVMQDVYLRILLNKRFKEMEIEEKKLYIKWLIGNRVIDLYRRSTTLKRAGKNVGISESVLIDLITNPDVYSKLELKEIMQKAKGNHTCATLFLNVAGYTAKEIAEITNCKLNTVLGRFRYARLFLRA